MKGMIAAGSPESAKAGAKMFELGGNAVDAAVAAAFASVVAEFSVVDITAGGYATVVDHPGDGRFFRANAYDFFHAMPTKGNCETYDFHRILVDFGSDVQPFYIGRASTAVPGLVAGLCLMAEERGSLSLPQLLEPAIKMAYEGVRVSSFTAHTIDLLKNIFTDTEPMRKVFAAKGHLIGEGETICMPALGRTLERLGNEGAAFFYEGEIAEKLTEDHRTNGGFITRDDLRSYRVEKREPISVDYHGYQVLLPGPSSNGGVLVAFALKLLNRIDVSQWRFHSVEHVRALALAMSLTEAARVTWHKLKGDAQERLGFFLGDDHLNSYEEKLRAGLNGAPIEALPRQRSAGNTTHLSTMDHEGTAVSITFSSGEHAGYLLDDTGIMLNNILGEIDLNPHGFHMFEPGTRLESMMSPVIVLDGGSPVLSVGSAGSNRIRSAILQVISNRLDFNLNLDEAINCSRVHYEDFVLHLEGGIPEEVATGLKGLGPEVNAWTRQSLYFGGAQAVARGTNGMEAAADRRRGAGIASCN